MEYVDGFVVPVPAANKDAYCVYHIPLWVEN